MKKSFFITFEGPEGGGKTTQIHLLRDYLAELKYNALITRQPGGEAVGVELRKILLDVGRETVNVRAELLMMMADRSQSVETVIQPHLQNGGVVLCDRYIDSSVAYQGGGRQIDTAWIAALNNYATAGLLPDITFLLDIDPSIGLTRQSDRNKMEFLDAAFHNRVRSAYLLLADQYPERIKLIDASLTIEDVHQQIVAILKQSSLLC